MRLALQQAQQAAWAPNEYVEQESFVSAREILALAEHADIAQDTTVLDLCCGVAGPGRFVTRERGCSYVGVDASADAIEIARERAGDLPCRFIATAVPPLPAGTFDVVLLLETMLAFRDKGALVEAIAGGLTPRGRFAFTLEAGCPLSDAERAEMPEADTVWLTPLDEMQALLAAAGLRVQWQQELSRSHRNAAAALADAYEAEGEAIASAIGAEALDKLLTAHRLWVEWLSSGRVRKFAIVAELLAHDE